MNKKILVFSLLMIPSISIADNYDQRLSNLESSVNTLNSTLSNKVNMLIDSIDGSYNQLDMLKADSSSINLLTDQVTELQDYKLNKSVFNKEHYDRIDVEDDLYEVKADKTDLDKVKDNVNTNSQNLTSISLKTDNAYNLSHKNKNDIDLLNNRINSNNQYVLSEANSYTDFNVNRLNNKIKKLQKESRGGISSAIAMANIPTTPNIGKFNIGFGVGHFEDASSLALGSTYRFNQFLTSKFSIANSNNTTSLGAGMSYDF